MPGWGSRRRTPGHGESGSKNQTATPEYRVWTGMLDRCLNPRNRNYRNYGRRGIRVCRRWRRYVNFLADMGRRPSPAHTLDRRDNNGHYEPDNCRWATRLEQARNKRTRRWLEINGVRKLLAEWAEESGIPWRTIWERVHKLGWDPMRAVYEPVDTMKQRAGATGRFAKRHAKEAQQMEARGLKPEYGLGEDQEEIEGED